MMSNQYTLVAFSHGGRPEAEIQVNPAPRTDLRELACYFAHGIKADDSWWVMVRDEFGEEITQWGCDDLNRYRRLLNGEPMTTVQALIAQGQL